MKMIPKLTIQRQQLLINIFKNFLESFFLYLSSLHKITICGRLNYDLKDMLVLIYGTCKCYPTQPRGLCNCDKIRDLEMGEYGGSSLWANIVTHHL
jgi:hypothetical protein